jgi:glycosyltransferase involved in cell wall biosynthesis
MECRFSIIVPTYNRPDQLLWCLGAIAELCYPRAGFEVIVVNDGGAIPPEPALAGLAEQMQLTVLAQERAGPACARNRGVERARGEYLAFTDDDCAPMPEWLAALEEALRRVPGAMIGGHTVNVLDGNLCSEASQLLSDYLYGYFNGPFDRGTNFFMSNNLAISARAFRELRGFDSSLGRPSAEDRELCARWRLAGGRFHYAPDAVVRHAHALTLRAFAQQHFAYGRGAYQFRVRHIQRGGEPIRLEPLTFYTGLLAFPFQRYQLWRAAPVGLLMGISQVANAAGFFWERQRQGGR